MAQLGQQQRDMVDVAERVQRLENELRRQTELLERFKEVQNWNQAELQRWAEAALQKEEDALTLALYQRQDEAKVKELNLKLERSAHPACLLECRRGPCRLRASRGLEPVCQAVTQSCTGAALCQARPCSPGRWLAAPAGPARRRLRPGSWQARTRPPPQLCRPSWRPSRWSSGACSRLPGPLLAGCGLQLGPLQSCAQAMLCVWCLGAAGELGRSRTRSKACSLAMPACKHSRWLAVHERRHACTQGAA